MIDIILLYFGKYLSIEYYSKYIEYGGMIFYCSSNPCNYRRYNDGYIIVKSFIYPDDSSIDAILPNSYWIYKII